MTDTSQAAYLISQAVAAMIEAMGMHAENQYRVGRGETIAYRDETFFGLIDKYGLHHNDAITTLRIHDHGTL